MVKETWNKLALSGHRYYQRNGCWSLNSSNKEWVTPKNTLKCLYEYCRNNIIEKLYTCTYLWWSLLKKIIKYKNNRFCPDKTASLCYLPAHILKNHAHTTRIFRIWLMNMLGNSTTGLLRFPIDHYTKLFFLILSTLTNEKTLIISCPATLYDEVICQRNYHNMKRVS